MNFFERIDISPSITKIVMAFFITLFICVVATALDQHEVKPTDFPIELYLESDVKKLGNESDLIMFACSAQHVNETPFLSFYITEGFYFNSTRIHTIHSNPFFEIQRHRLFYRLKTGNSHTDIEAQNS